MKQDIYAHTFMAKLYYFYYFWNGTRQELILLINELNKKHKPIKFYCKIFSKQIEFVDTVVDRDQQHKIQTTIFRKPTDQQTYLHAQSNHPKSLKNSIPYSQALHIKTVCSTTSEFNRNCDIITKRFKEKRYPENLVNEQVDKVKNIRRKQLFSTNKRTIQHSSSIT